MRLYDALPVTRLPDALVALVIVADFLTFYMLAYIAFGE